MGLSAQRFEWSRGNNTVKQGAAALEKENPRQHPQDGKLLVFGYLFHLLVPAFLLLDVLIAWWRGEIAPKRWGTDTIIAECSAVWLVTGVGALIVSRERQRFLRSAYRPLMGVYATYVSLIILATLLQVTAHFTPPLPGRLPPGRTRIGPIDPGVLPGVEGTKTFSINKLGLRGPLPTDENHAYKIMAIGGSTTICTFLDDSEEWTHVLMEQLNASQKTYRVWVGNAGMSGRTSVHHLVLMQWLPGLVDMDMVIFLVGVNDLYLDLRFKGAPTQEAAERSAGYLGDLPPGKRARLLYPYYRRLELLQLIDQSAQAVKQQFGQAERPLDLVELPVVRERRAAGPIVPLPDLHTGLKEYRQRLLALAKRCRTLELRCLFLTQPSMWRSDLSTTEQRLLWAGRVGPWPNYAGYVAAGEMAQGMAAFNRTLLDVCEQNGLECYDLASHIPKDTSAFYDDVHFNEAGARLVAQQLKEYLLARGPFGTRAADR